MFWFMLLVLVPIFIFILVKDLRQRCFAFLMSLFAHSNGKIYREIKQDFFKTLQSHVSHDPDLRRNSSLRILEIGVGSGANFEHYPDGTHLIVIDPNPHFKTYYDKNRSKFSNIKTEEIIVCKGEDMDMISTGSIDVVVMTLVLCSVADIPALLKQVHRVLAPEGKFFFQDHIKEFGENHSTRLWLQNILTSSQVWPLLFDGCELNRDMLEDIRKCGFSNVNANRFYVNHTNCFMQICAPHLQGVAVK